MGRRKMLSQYRRCAGWTLSSSYVIEQLFDIALCLILKVFKSIWYEAKNCTWHSGVSKKRLKEKHHTGKYD